MDIDKLIIELPVFVPLSPGSGQRCGCTTCECGDPATHVSKSGLCVCDECLHCPAAPPPQSRLDDNLQGVFG